MNRQMLAVLLAVPPAAAGTRAPDLDTARSVAVDPVTGAGCVRHFDSFTAAALAHQDGSAKSPASPRAFSNAARGTIGLIRDDQQVWNSSVVWGHTVVWGGQAIWGNSRPLAGAPMLFAER